MKTTLVVDAYNAINAIPEVRKEKKGLRHARKAIMDICREYARSSGYITDIKVVFDGNDRYRYMDIPRDSTQVFSETDKGDKKIIDTVRVCSRQGRVVLASNDNYVRNNSRAYGASLIDVRELTETKKREHEPEKNGDKHIGRRTREEIDREYREELGL